MIKIPAQEKMAWLLRREDNCRWVRDAIRDKQAEEDNASAAVTV